MYRAFRGLSLFILAALAMPLPADAAEPTSIAAFDFELIDTSLEGEVDGVRADQLARLGLISDDLRRRLGESGRYRIVDTAPARARIEAAGYLHGCPRCAAAIAKELGAEQALTGTVQKVSNLILNINLYLHDAASGVPLRAWSVDIRGNSDTSWLRGVSYLVRNRLLRDER